MKKQLFLSVILGIILLLTAAGCLGSGGNSTQQTVETTRGSIALKVNGNGNLDVINEARLAFSSSGKVIKIYVSKGDTVIKGMVLARLDTNALNLSLAQAEAAVVQARYNITKLHDTPSESDITAAKSAVTAAKDYLKYAQENQKALDDALTVAQSNYNQAKLFNQPLVMEQVQAALSRSQAAVTGGLADISRAQANLDSAQAQLARLLEPPDQDAIIAAQAQLNSAEKSVTELNRQISEAVIFSTMDGIVAEDVAAEENDVVTAGKPIFHIIDPVNMELVVDVDEIDIPNVVLGQKAAITFDALSGITLEGTVTYISPLPTATGGVILYKVTIEFTISPEVKVKDGMSAAAEIVVEQHDNVVILANRAISQDNEGNNYVEVDSGGTTAKKQVVLGISDGFDTEIVRGLEAGEKVLVPKSSESSSSLFGG